MDYFVWKKRMSGTQKKFKKRSGEKRATTKNKSIDSRRQLWQEANPLYYLLWMGLLARKK
jgi:hypothetical protein